MKRILFLAIISIVGILAIIGCDKQKTYEVVFDANGGIGTMQTQTFVEGESQAIKDNSFVNKGRRFKGWNTLPDGSSISYTDGQVITLVSDITLYAQWTSKETEQTAPEVTEQVGPIDLNGHEWVDLGLPSGTKWATCNVGTNTPEGYGDYFAWGETSPKKIYYWHTYLHSRGDAYCSFLKYNPSNDPEYGYAGFTDNLTTLEACDDAATANWGEAWRIPTQDEMQELFDNCTSTWTNLNGINGRKFTGPNGNSIFLPAAGHYYDIMLMDDGSDGSYWTSSVYFYNPNYAWMLKFSSDNCLINHQRYRYNGQPVRPVLAQ